MLAEVVDGQACADGGHDVVADLIGGGGGAGLEAGLRVGEAGGHAAEHHGGVHDGDDDKAVGAADATELAERDIKFVDVVEDQEAGDAIEGGGSIPPPDRERLEEISKIAREVDELIRNAQTADALLDAANAAIKLANGVKGVAD